MRTGLPTPPRATARNDDGGVASARCPGCTIHAGRGSPAISSISAPSAASRARMMARSSASPASWPVPVGIATKRSRSRSIDARSAVIPCARRISSLVSAAVV